MRKYIILSVVAPFIIVLAINLAQYSSFSTLTDFDQFPHREEINSITLISIEEDDEETRVLINHLDSQNSDQFYNLLTDFELANGNYSGENDYSIRLRTNEGSFRIVLNENGEARINENAYQVQNYEETLNFIYSLEGWEHLSE